MNARAERRRTERAVRKEARRAARWLRDIPEPTMAAARRLTAGLLEGGAADPDGAAARRLTFELLAFADAGGVPVERAAETVRAFRERGLAIITAAGGLSISDEQAARIEAVAEELGVPDEADDPDGPPPAPLQLTKKGAKAIADMVVAMAHETGHSVEQVALSLRDLHESGGATIDEDGTVALLPEEPGPDGGRGDADPLVEAVRAAIGAPGTKGGRS